MKTPAQKRRMATTLARAYQILRDQNGHLGWWPGRTRLEIITGAILTQNTAWANVEKAIRAMRASRLLSLEALRAAPYPEIERAIRPSGYFRQKARKLKTFVAYLDQEYAGSLRRMAAAPCEYLRPQLLSIWGIGPETADSILLYAFGHPVFVVDAYTKRIVTRHGWAVEDIGYHGLQQLFVRHLPPDAALYSDYHAQLVWVGKHFCRKTPRCEGCPLRVLMRDRRPGS